MFPSLLAQPETTLLTPFLVYSVLTFGTLLFHFKKIILSICLCVILITPTASAFMYVPGGCGTQCMAQSRVWGQPTYYPSVYAYPYMPSPWMFYQNPMSYYPMLPPWYAY